MSNNQTDPFGQFMGAGNDVAANLVKDYAFGKVRDQYE